jgi:hypothetical protein
MYLNGQMKSGNNRYAYCFATSNNPVLTTNGVSFPASNTNAQMIFNNYVPQLHPGIFLLSLSHLHPATNTFRTLIKGLAQGTHVIL